MEKHTSRKILRLSFLTSQGASKQIQITRGKDTYEKTELKELMEAIATSNQFAKDGVGQYATPISVETVETKVDTQLDMDQA